ncbi:DUF402 domain-containing protein [Streptomyces sp. RS10V-4]|uniref:DUF402 domain-containing protein n=1 Tax=Streptomyces rhizoryzae TaxID=2932493 RepID=UPI0020052578|nr:DUF402 domain-containing protein [Streptomyces rhizoryzae]MCK7626579.1 DUF402 domain-containing protein [Streptomyces rhizoryzae]
MADGTVLTTGGEVHVTLVKAGRTKVRYPATVVRDDGVRAVVRAPWARPGVRDFGFVRFEPGDLFTEHYWRDRWYAVKEVRAADGTLKGWYCDVTRPAEVGADGIAVEDLDLDLWCAPDGGPVLRLDEDEFADSGIAERDPAAAARARSALEELDALARAGRLPALTGPPTAP